MHTSVYMKGGLSMTEKDKERQDEGRRQYFMDVDRMINEGLGGGTVDDNRAGMIEEARPLQKEDPPSKTT